jgi:hypothetical protein
MFTVVKRPRVLLGIELVLAALFLLRAHDCGFVGERAARGLTFLFGQYGTMLIAVGLAAAGVAVAVPRRTWTAVAGAVAALGSRRRSSPEKSGSIQTRKTASNNDSDSATTAGQLPTPPVLADVRGCLRQLGYTAGEIESVMPRLDPKVGFDGMVRDALQLLGKTA